MIIAQRGKSCGSGFKRIGMYCVRSDIVETIKGEGYPTWLLGDFLAAIGEDEVEERRFLDLWSAKDALLTQFEEALQPVRQKLLAQGIVAKEVTSVEIPWQCPEGQRCNALKVFLTALGNVKRGMKTARAAHMIYSLDLAFNIVKATERKFAEWAEGFYIHPEPLWMNIYMLYDYAYWYGNKRHRKAVEKILENHPEDPCKGVAKMQDGEIEIRLYDADVVVAAETNACLHSLGIDNVRVLRGCAVVVGDSKKIQEYTCEIIIREDNEIEFEGGPYGDPSGEFKILSTRERRLARRALLRLSWLVEKLEGIELEDENRIWNFLYSASKTMLRGYTLIRGHEIIIDNPVNLRWWGLPAAAPAGTTVKDLKRLHYLLDAFSAAIELIDKKERKSVELPFESLVAGKPNYIINGSLVFDLNRAMLQHILLIYGIDLKIDIRKDLPGPAGEDRGTVIYIDGRPYGISSRTYMVITSDKVEVRNVVPLRKTKEEERRLVSEWSEVFDILTKKPLPTPMPFIEDVINQFVENLIEYAPISVIWRYLPDYVPDVDAKTIKEIMSLEMLPIYRKIANILIKASGYDI